MREKPDETERLFMDIDLSSLMELLERNCGREYREVVEEILGNDEAYDNVVPNDHSFLLLKDFCQDVSSGEEEFDVIEQKKFFFVVLVATEPYQTVKYIIQNKWESYKVRILQNFHFHNQILNRKKKNHS